MRFAFFNNKGMKNLIDESYFWGELEIQGLFKNAVGSLMGEAGNNAASKFERYIKLYQRRYLDEMFFEGFEPNDEVIAMLANDELKTSPIANYIYYFYKRSNETFSTVAGEKQMQIVNTQIADYRAKMRNAWNEGVKINRLIHQKMYDSPEIGDINYLNDILPMIDIENDVFSFIFDL